VQPLPRQVKIELIAILLLTGLILAGSRGILIQAGTIDAYFYTSFIHNYADLVERFGNTYYSTRIAHIYPASILASALGPEKGYVAYRFMLLSAALISVWAMIRSYYPVAVGILLVVGAAFSPWLLRSLFWDYTDSSGVVYLLVCTALFATASGVAKGRLLLAGAFSALAANTNLYLLGVSGLLLPAWLLSRPASFHSRAKSVAAYVSGFAACYLSLCVVRYVQFPQHGFLLDAIPFKVAANLMEGGAEEWFIDPSWLIWNGWVHILIPPAVWLTALFVWFSWPGMRTPVLRFSLLHLGFVMGLYLISSFGFHLSVIGLPYYFVFLLPASLLCWGVVVGSLAAKHPQRRVAPILIGIALLSPVWHFLYPVVHPLDARLPAWGFVLAAGLALLCVAASRWFPMLGLAVVSLLMAASPLALCKPVYNRIPILEKNRTVDWDSFGYGAIYQANPALEWDLYRAAIWLRSRMDRFSPGSGRIGFWYSGDRGSYLNSVQSVGLFLYSRLHRESSEEMPNLTPALQQQLQRIRILFLLAEDPLELDAGMEAIEKAGIRVLVRDEEVYTGQACRIAYRILELPQE